MGDIQPATDTVNKCTVPESVIQRNYMSSYFKVDTEKEYYF